MPVGTREGKAEEIIKAAIRVFSEYGYDSAKMEYIAKEAGIGKGTIYEYFTSKDQLFEKIITYSIEQFCRDLKARIEEGETIEEKLVHCSVFNAEFINSHLDLVQVAVEVNLFPKEMRGFLLDAQAKVQAYYFELVRTAMKKGELRADLNEELAVFCIMGAIEQFCKQRLFCGRRSLEELDHLSMVELLLNGMR